MWKRFEKLPLIPLGAAGFLIGMIFVIFHEEKGNLLNLDHLYKLREMTVDPGGYLYEIVKVRGGMMVFLLLVSTTYLAPVFCILTAGWIGVSMGSFQMMALCNYGIKGILLLPAVTLPQFLIYLPAFYCLLRWCEGIYGAIYRRKEWKKGNAIAGLVLIVAAMALGIFVEYHMGPVFLQDILRSF